MRKLLALLLVIATGLFIYYMSQSGGAEPSNQASIRTQASATFAETIQSEPKELSESTKSPEPTQSEEPAAPAYASDSDLILINTFNQLSNAHNPQDLINLYEQKNRSFQLARSDIFLCQKAYDAANAMFAAAKADGVEGFIITSGYRSREKQQELWDARTDDTVVKPGASEHETGLAFDVTAMDSQDGFDKTPQFEWLSKHCAEHGFILRYPEGKESITGVPYEPWHYRYVGNHAKDIHLQNLTLEEYLSN